MKYLVRLLFFFALANGFAACDNKPTQQQLGGALADSLKMANERSFPLAHLADSLPNPEWLQRAAFLQEVLAFAADSLSLDTARSFTRFTIDPPVFTWLVASHPGACAGAWAEAVKAVNMSNWHTGYQPVAGLPMALVANAALADSAKQILIAKGYDVMTYAADFAQLAELGITQPLPVYPALLEKQPGRLAAIVLQSLYAQNKYAGLPQLDASCNGAVPQAVALRRRLTYVTEEYARQLCERHYGNDSETCLNYTENVADFRLFSHVVAKAYQELCYKAEDAGSSQALLHSHLSVRLDSMRELPFHKPELYLNYFIEQPLPSAAYMCTYYIFRGNDPCFAQMQQSSRQNAM